MTLSSYTLPRFVPVGPSLRAARTRPEAFELWWQEVLRHGGAELPDRDVYSNYFNHGLTPMEAIVVDRAN